MAASGLIGGVFGRLAERGGIGLAGGLAILGLVAVAAFCVVVLVPRPKEWAFGVSPGSLLKHHVDVPERNTPEQLHRFLAEYMEQYYDENEQKLERLYLFFWWACVVLTVDIGLWLLELVT